MVKRKEFTMVRCQKCGNWIHNIKLKKTWKRYYKFKINCKWCYNLNIYKIPKKRK